MKESKYIKSFFVGFFLLILVLPVFQMLTGLTPFSSIEKHMKEKRLMAPKPVLSSDSLNLFPEKYSTYFDDHFGFRKPLILVNNYIKTIQFNISNHKKVIIGKDGWFFYNDQGSLADHTGQEKLSKIELEKIKTSLELKKKHCDSIGAKFYFVVLPDKMSVYSEYLPNHITCTDSTRLNQLIDYLKDSKTPVISVKEALLGKSKEHHIFQKIDSHWNRNGAFIATQHIIKRLKSDFPSLNPPSYHQFKVSAVDKVSGDLAGMLGLVPLLPNTKFNYIPQFESLKKRLPQTDYIHYKVGYKKTFKYEIPNSISPKLLVFNDSYVSYIHGFLSDHFSNSTFLWTHDFKTDAIEIEKPDIIIYMMVERSIKRLVNK
jgi:alginate O-acetyltransferase complex protein AlgJ